MAILQNYPKTGGGLDLTKLFLESHLKKGGIK